MTDEPAFVRLGLLAYLAAQGISSSGSGVNANDVGFDVWLIMGQSNATGTNSDYAAPLDFTDARVTQWPYDGTYIGNPIVAQDPMIHPSGNITPNSVGFGVNFGKYYAASIPSNRRVLLVPAGRNGTALADGWLAPSGSYLLGAVASANAAVASATNNRFIGAIWMQGEQDVGAGTSTATYANGLDGIIDYVRANVTGATNSLFLVHQMKQGWGSFSTPAAQAINLAHLMTPARKQRAAFSYDALATAANNIHYNGAEQRANGVGLFKTIPFASANVTGNLPVQMAEPSVAYLSSTAISLSWVFPLSRVTSFKYGWRVLGGGAYTIVDTASLAIRATLSGLVNSTVYDVIVYATNEAGDGTASSPVTFSIATLPTVPQAPTSLTLGTSGSTYQNLSWTAPASGSAPTDYQVQYAAAGSGVWTTFAHAASTATAIQVTGLAASTSYDYRVAGVNANGTGAYSSTATGATPAGLLWNPSDKSAAMTLANGNRDIANGSSGGYQSVRVNTSKTTGKWAFQVQYVSVSGTPSTGPGIGDSGFTLANYMGATERSFFLNPGNGASPTVKSATFTTVNQGSVGAVSAGDTLEIYFDLDAGKAWVSKNNVMLFSGNPDAGANPWMTWTPVGTAYFPGATHNPGTGVVLRVPVALIGTAAATASSFTLLNN